VILNLEASQIENMIADNHSNGCAGIRVENLHLARGVLNRLRMFFIEVILPPGGKSVMHVFTGEKCVACLLPVGP